jgi:hypothetical protein
MLGLEDRRDPTRPHHALLVQLLQTPLEDPVDSLGRRVVDKEFFVRSVDECRIDRIGDVGGGEDENVLAGLELV